MKRTRRLPLLGCMVLTVLAAPVHAQDQTPPAERFFPQQGFLLTGYGGAGYTAVFADDALPNNFSAVFAPLMLFQISDRFLFEGEFEFEIEDGVTATELEYAQVDVAVHNNLTVVAGKFLLPFAAFSERYHPTWINQLPSGPALYGTHGAILPTDPMLPVLTDIGVQAQANFAVGRFSTLSAVAFVTQGPTIGGDDHAEEEEEPHDEERTVSKRLLDPGAGEAGVEFAELAFGGNATDNNENKMVGGRLGFNLAPFFEVSLSGMTGTYDPGDALRFSALGAHVEGSHRGLSLHGELLQTWQELGVLEDNHDEEEPGEGDPDPMEEEEEPHEETLARTGYWVQASYQVGQFEPVVRWSQLFGADVDGVSAVDAGRQLALGLDYWFQPTLVLKAAYVLNLEEHEDIANNSFTVQLAFGF